MAMTTKTPARDAAAKTRPAAKRPVARKTAAAPRKRATPAAKAVKTAATATPEATAPAKRDKLVRDGFTIPKSEFAVLQQLKERAAKLGCGATKKSEVLRAGLKALAALSDQAFAAAMQAVPSIKTGRPAKGGQA